MTDGGGGDTTGGRNDPTEGTGSRSDPTGGRNEATGAVVTMAGVDMQGVHRRTRRLRCGGIH